MKKPVRLTYIQQHFALPSEAGFVRPWEFARRLQRDGYSVTVVRGGPQNAETVLEGVRIRTVAAPYANEMSFRRRIVSFLQFLVKASVETIRSRPAIVLASSTPLTVAIPAILASIRPSTRFIFEVRDLWPEVPVKLGLVTNRYVIWAAKMLEKLTYRRADAIVALSPYMEQGVLKVAPGARTVVIPNGCDLAEFDDAMTDRESIREQLGVGTDEKLVVYAGGFGFLYDLPRCVELAARLAPDGVRFTFIGKGSESEKLKELADELGISREGLFPGIMPKREVIRFLKASDAILSPLRSAPVLEGCSLNKVFDSMAAGRPVLMNHGGWLADAVTAIEAGWRIPTDPSLAAEVVREILADTDELERRGKNNRALGESKFSRDDQYDSLFNLVSSLATRN
ncbi:glycosyltransferase family 4 protein [Dietzia maris]|uniref:glycosyltransferase family 4 protein n=1 Tax=Dietzia maris TaxID=37915 RepID=UPI00344F5AA6